MNTDKLFYESMLDAVNVVVLALGGPQEVGKQLWPSLKSSTQRVRDCLNPNRDEKFSLDELVKLARWGRDAGCHAIAVYFNAEAGYQAPVPLSAQEEKQELARQALDAVKQFELLTRRIEAAGGLR